MVLGWFEQPTPARFWLRALPIKAIEPNQIYKILIYYLYHILLLFSIVFQFFITFFLYHFLFHRKSPLNRGSFRSYTSASIVEIAEKKTNFSFWSLQSLILRETSSKDCKMPVSWKPFTTKTRISFFCMSFRYISTFHVFSILFNSFSFYLRAIGSIPLLYHIFSIM